MIDEKPLGQRLKEYDYVVVYAKGESFPYVVGGASYDFTIYLKTPEFVGQVIAALKSGKRGSNGATYFSRNGSMRGRKIRNDRSVSDIVGSNLRTLNENEIKRYHRGFKRKRKPRDPTIRAAINELTLGKSQGA
tara:strand:- start:1346 stop:1747 length:402 start_codon:yes stop_codon:yes gene_type:complete